MAEELTENEKQAKITRDAALEMAWWLDGRGYHQKRVRELRLEDLFDMAAAALARAAVTRSQIEAEEKALRSQRDPGSILA